jgi:hypothetical protein
LPINAPILFSTSLNAIKTFVVISNGFFTFSNVLNVYATFKDPFLTFYHSRNTIVNQTKLYLNKVLIINVMRVAVPYFAFSH